MAENDWTQALDQVRSDLAGVERKANGLVVRLPAICRTLESVKIDLLKGKLVNEQRDLARRRGVGAQIQDPRNLGIGLAVGLGGLILSALATRDKDLALSTGLRSVDGFTQGLGQSSWVVSLDREMLVAARNQAAPGRFWVTLESFSEALGLLREKALAGEKIGGLEAILSALRQDRRTLRYVLPPAPKATKLVPPSAPTGPNQDTTPTSSC